MVRRGRRAGRDRWETDDPFERRPRGSGRRRFNNEYDEQEYEEVVQAHDQRDEQDVDARPPAAPPVGGADGAADAPDGGAPAVQGDANVQGDDDAAAVAPPVAPVPVVPDEGAEGVEPPAVPDPITRMEAQQDTMTDLLRQVGEAYNRVCAERDSARTERDAAVAISNGAIARLNALADRGDEVVERARALLERMRPEPAP